MSRRIDIELTSALPDNSWTWRAAGAKQPKGTLDGSILSDGASVGDVIKVEVEQEIDGITVVSVVGGRQKQARDDVLELLPSEREFQPVIETRAKRDRNDRGGGRRRDGDRKPRGNRGERGDRGDRGDRSDRGDGGRDRGRGRDGRSEGDRSGRGGERRQRRGPSFTPPPEVPQRPKPKRLKPGKANRNAVLAELPEEQRAIAELALQGMGAVRQRLKDENAKAAAEGRPVMPESTVLKLAEDMLPKLRVAEWRDRAEAALRQLEHLDLRDLRSVVAAAGDPTIVRDESTRALASELTSALATKQEQELHLWFGDVDAALAVGRVIRALRLSSQPPKAGVPFPTDIAQRLIDSANASLAPMDPPERWIAMLEAAAFSPVRTSIVPERKPDQISDELVATVRRLAPALPQVAALFGVEVDPKAPMPKPLRPGPRKGKNERQKSDRRPKQASPRRAGTGADSGSKARSGSDSGIRPPAPPTEQTGPDREAAEPVAEPPTETPATSTAPQAPTPASEPPEATSGTEAPTDAEVQAATPEISTEPTAEPASEPTAPQAPTPAGEPTEATSGTEAPTDATEPAPAAAAKPAAVAGGPAPDSVDADGSVQSTDGEPSSEPTG